ncbi:MAG: hypothetical protein FWF18_02615 [Dehalococcoidia bacterium]|nr:hypothetical protein [Dehalococcoidia bacterium]
MTKQSVRLGEIIEASTTGFSAQSYELNELPALGSLVMTSEGERKLYAVVYHAATEGIEPGRRPIARGRDEPSEQALFDNNPQLARLLRSRFSALVVGYRDGSAIRQHLPPKPAHIHAFVHACPQEEVKEFGQSFNFLNTLIGAELETPADELTASTLRLIAEVQDDPRALLVAAGKELAMLLGRDYTRLKAILERIKP